MRVFEGTVRPGDTIKLMNTGATFQLVEVGHMGATALAPAISWRPVKSAT